MTILDTLRKCAETIAELDRKKSQQIAARDKLIMHTLAAGHTKASVARAAGITTQQIYNIIEKETG